MKYEIIIAQNNEIAITPLAFLQKNSHCGTLCAVISMKKQLRSSALLLVATIIWGSAFVSQSIAANHIGPFTFQAVRSFMAFLAMLPLIALMDQKNACQKNFWQRWVDPQLWIAGLLCGIPLFLATNLQQMGLADTDAGKSGFLTAMYIVIVPLIGIFRGQKPTVLIPLSVCIAVAGLYCLSCMGETDFRISDLLLLGCALMFAVQITVVDIYVSRVDPIRLNALQVLICSILSAVFMAFTETPSLSGIQASFLPLLHTGILSMGVAYGLQIIAQKDLPPAPAALIMSLESVFALIFGFVFLQETMTQWEFAGCALVFAAVILSQIPLKPKNEST